DIGVPENALILENESQNTYENALKAKEILTELEIEQILLVTSAMHMPRSVALFEKQGFEVIPLPVDFSVTQNDSAEKQNGGWVNRVLNVIPSASNLALTTSALKEYLGMLIYTLQGWM
ncbi:MAG: YdcF family protein, partial [Chloroflexi bacterium]|nr:YdcF family protein [Chloroflexota bacterium]